MLIRGLARELAAGVDGVLNGQVERYARFVNTGKPWTERP